MNQNNKRQQVLMGGRSSGRFTAMIELTRRTNSCILVGDIERKDFLLKTYPELEGKVFCKEDTQSEVNDA